MTSVCTPKGVGTGPKVGLKVLRHGVGGGGGGGGGGGCGGGGTEAEGACAES